jgi:hypothetical protein
LQNDGLAANVQKFIENWNPTLFVFMALPAIVLACLDHPKDDVSFVNESLR